jgi:phage terminase large subunit-like protein
VRSHDVNDRLAGAFRYAEGVVAGEINVCAYVKLACKRFLDDVDAAERGDSPWKFDTNRATGPLILASVLPNIKGPQAGKPIELMDWQKLVLANLFGFIERGRDARRFRQGIV